MDQDYLFCCTFTRPGDGYLERYYSTYGISSTGQPFGLYPSRHHYLYPLYKIVDQFAGIASALLVFNLFEEYSALWFDAIQCALTQTLEEIHHPCPA